MDEYKVYVRTNADGTITAINSSAFLSDTIIDVDSWTQIDSGIGDRYAHAQGNYLAAELTDCNGIYNYKLADGAAVLRTDSDKAADIAAVAQAARRAAIMARFTEIDAERIRPLSALALGTATAVDTDKLCALEAQAAALRSELAGFEL